MFKNRTASLASLILLTFLWTLPAYGLVITGPTLTQVERNWGDFGLIFRAEADITLVSVEFPNQGRADVIQLRRYLDGEVLASIPVAGGNYHAIVDINYPLDANETYALVATTPTNKYYGPLGVFRFPVTNGELTVLSSYLGRPNSAYWLSFNNITTELRKQTIEAVVDIKPGSDVNPINLRSKGLVPVAILTTDALDALSVDLNSIVFAGARPAKSAVQDVDGDGNMDLLLHFRTADLSELTADSTEAVLTGATVDSISIVGKDSVKILAPAFVQ